MRRFHGWMGASFLAATIMGAGCGFQRPPVRPDAPDQSTYHSPSTRLDYPDVATPLNEGLLATRAPLTVLNENEIQFEYLSLQDAVRSALRNSKVLRDLGGSVLRAPGNTTSTYDVALQELDPRFGVAAALSDFDANLSSSFFAEKNDKALNNQFFGGGTRLLQQDYLSSQTALTKRAATGTQFTLRNNTDYDSNNAPGNKFESAFNTNVEASVKHPLLRGGGAEFNRIGGPSGQPGALNGVVLARINTDISLTQFEMSVRDFVSNVENSYWDLYFAYRDLDAKIVARNTSLQTWNAVHALYEAGRVGGEAEKESQARVQYLKFQEQVQNALSGRPVDSTATNNGSGGGAFRGTAGVLTAERKLRLVMGLPINEGKLLRPGDEPIEARVVFQWDATLCEGLQRRAELRRQKWIVKRREQEYIASANFLLPQLDLAGRWRWRGFGQDLLDQGRDRGQFDNAVGDLVNGDFQEWQVGLEFAVPLGRRKGHAARQFAEMQLTRDRSVLAEQEREVVHQLSNVISELDRAYAILENATDRRLASAEQLEAVQAAYESDKASLDLLLRAQQSQLEADTDYYKSLVEYTLAIRNVHFEKGSLLDYNEIYLTEDLWPMQAYQDAQAREKLKVPAEWIDNIVTRPIPVQAGEYLQDIPGPSEGSAIPQPLEVDEPSPVAPAPESQPKLTPAPAATSRFVPASDGDDSEEDDDELMERDAILPVSFEEPAFDDSEDSDDDRRLPLLP